MEMKTRIFETPDRFGMFLLDSLADYARNATNPEPLLVQVYHQQRIDLLHRKKGLYTWRLHRDQLKVMLPFLEDIIQSPLNALTPENIGTRAFGNALDVVSGAHRMFQKIEFSIDFPEMEVD
jgi:hypothetical protein